MTIKLFLSWGPIRGGLFYSKVGGNQGLRYKEKQASPCLLDGCYLSSNIANGNNNCIFSNKT